MYIGIGTIVLIVIIVLVVLMLRRRLCPGRSMVLDLPRAFTRPDRTPDEFGLAGGCPRAVERLTARSG
jgi:hypothetical protein